MTYQPLPHVQVLDRVTAAHEKLEFGDAGRTFYDFFWAQYADWYIESAKTRLYSSDPAVSQTTRKVGWSLLPSGFEMCPWACLVPQAPQLLCQAILYLKACHAANTSPYASDPDVSLITSKLGALCSSAHAD